MFCLTESYFLANIFRKTNKLFTILSLTLPDRFKLFDGLV